MPHPLFQHLRLPAIASPLFIISVPQRGTAQRKAGIVGSMPALDACPAALLDRAGIVLHDVIDNRFARKAIEKGADGLIAGASGAGGHAGITSAFALAPEIRRWFDGPLVLSGAIATGGAALAAQARVRGRAQPAAAPRVSAGNGASLSPHARQDRGRAARHRRPPGRARHGQAAPPLFHPATLSGVDPCT